MQSMMRAPHEAPLDVLWGWFIKGSTASACEYREAGYLEELMQRWILLFIIPVSPRFFLISHFPVLPPSLASLSCGLGSHICSLFPLWFSWPDVSPRHRIQNISRFVWKQANVASELWEKLTARCVDQHRHIERTLEQLLEIKGAMEELSTTLDQAESVKETWEPIGDLFIDSLPEHIQSTKVLVALRRLQPWPWR